MNKGFMGKKRVNRIMGITIMIYERFAEKVTGALNTSGRSEDVL